jgi:hypothetical protein
MAITDKPAPPPYSRGAPEKLLLSAFDQTMRKVHNYCVQTSVNSSVPAIPDDLRQATKAENNAYHGNVKNHWIQFVKDSGYYKENEKETDKIPKAHQVEKIRDAEIRLGLKIGKRNLGQDYVYGSAYNSFFGVIQKLIHSFQEICGALYEKRKVTPHTV